MEFIYDFQDEIEVSGIEYFKLNPIRLPERFKDGTGGIRTASLFGDWIRITDTDGNVGEGPCTNLSNDFFAGILLELGPMTLNQIRETLYWRIRNFGYQSPYVREMGHLDLVFLDLLSRKHDQPLYKFLGAGRNYAEVYKGGGSVLKTDDELVQELSGIKAEGYHQTKFKVGYESWKRDLERLKKVRKALGDDFGIAVDANQGWDVDTAFEFLKEAREYNLSWMEEPVHAYDMEGLKELSERLSDEGIGTELAMGESVRSYYEFVQYMSHGVRHLQPGNAALSSIDEILKVKRLADAHGLRLSTGGITYVNVLLGALYDEGQLIEFHAPIMGVIEPYLSLGCRIEDGRWYLPEEPGIPMRLDFKKLADDGILNQIIFRKRQ